MKPDTITKSQVNSFQGLFDRQRNFFATGVKRSGGLRENDGRQSPISNGPHDDGRCVKQSKRNHAS